MIIHVKITVYLHSKRSRVKIQQNIMIKVTLKKEDRGEVNL